MDLNTQIALMASVLLGGRISGPVRTCTTEEIREAIRLAKGIWAETLNLDRESQ